jgi:hypothetical protein
MVGITWLVALVVLTLDFCSLQPRHSLSQWLVDSFVNFVLCPCGVSQDALRHSGLAKVVVLGVSLLVVVLVFAKSDVAAGTAAGSSGRSCRLRRCSR